MKILALITLLSISHLSTATIDVHELAKTAKTNLQKLGEETSTNLQKLTEEATANLQILKKQATENVQKLVSNIDFQKIQQYDFLNIIPTVLNLQSLLESHQFKDIPMIFDPSQGEKLRYYFQKLHGIKGQDLVDALGAGLPWPVLRRMDAV